MRIGNNPAKNRPIVKQDYLHQVIIPVYIPNFEGYFKDSFVILKYSLESLFKTANQKTFITVINNGSCNDIVEYLNELFITRRIHEVIHTENIGKNNAVLKAINGHDFQYITIADADVMFLNEWQAETIKIFNTFPKAGVVGIVPQFRMFTGLSYNVLFDNLWSGKMLFREVKNPEGMQHFYKSIGWNDDYNRDWLKVHLTLGEENKQLAVVGAGHFVATYKREAIQCNINEPITEPLSSKFDRQMLDLPVARVGGWRLTTIDNYAYHMGNVSEKWMQDRLNTLFDESKNQILAYPKHSLKLNWAVYFLKNHLFRKLMQNKWVFREFLHFKGLPKEISKRYLK